MNRNKKIITGLVLSAAVIGVGGYQLLNHDSNKTSMHNNMANKEEHEHDKEHNHKKDDKKKKEVIVTYITADGYSWLHGDHSHFKKGKIPNDAKFLEKVVMRDPNYKLKQEDIRYEVDQGYIIEVDKEFYYYPKPGVQQTNILTEDQANEISMKNYDGNEDGHSHSSEHKSSHTSDGYVFNPNDIVEEYSNGYVVRHGDHYHFIGKDKLTASELAAIDNWKKSGSIKATPISNTVTSRVGIDTPTDDGFIFDGSNIVGTTPNGLIVAHGNHTHFVSYSSLEGTRFSYLIPNKTPSTNVVDNTGSSNNTSSNTANQGDNNLEDKIKYLAKAFNVEPDKIIVDGDYLHVPHGDHYHSYKISDIDTSKPFVDPHHDHSHNNGTAKEVMVKTLGIDPELADAILIAPSNTKLDPNESNPDKIKEWISSLRYAPLDMMKDPLKLKGIEYLHNVEVLSLGHSKVSDVNDILKFKNIKHLWIPYSNVKDLDFLKDIKTLEGVDVSGLGLTNLDFVNNIPGLVAINAANNKITNIEPLRKFDNLWQVTLDNNNVKDLSPLKDKKKIELISLENNNIYNVSELSGLDNIKYLFLNGNENIDLNTLKLDNLSELHAENVGLWDLDFLKGLPNLAYLNVENNQLRSLKGIENSDTLVQIDAAHNHIQNLKASSSSLTNLDVSDNEIESLSELENFAKLNVLKVNDNQISKVSGKNDNIQEIYANNNYIDNLKGFVGYSNLTVLKVNDNFIKSMELDSTNSKLSTLEIVRNPLELEKNGEREVPKGMNSFTGLQAGGFSENYTLNEGYINTYTDQILAFIENNKSRMPKDKVDEFTSELKLIKLDVESSNDKSENKLKSAIKEILAVEKAAFDLAYSHHHHSHDNDGGHNDSTHSEDGFEFNIEDITDESGEGFVVAHGDHYHYVFFKDLTEDQIAQGREHLKKLKENQSNNPKEDTSPKDNTKTDDELEAEFEKELNSLASSMHVSPDSIRIEDGYMIVDHGDHDHRYKIKSDGWKIYIQNKIPHIEIPTISGSVDRSQVYREIAKIRERVNSELTGAKKRRALAWLDKFKDEDLAYGFTSTEGYLQGLKNFTDSQLDNKNSENENPKDVENSETPKANSETTTTAEGNENTIDKENRTEGVSPESSNQNMATEESNGDSTNISSEESSDNVTNLNSEESNINDSGEVSNNENEEVSSTEISTVDNESAPSEDETLHSEIESN